MNPSHPTPRLYPLAHSVTSCIDHGLITMSSKMRDSHKHTLFYAAFKVRNSGQWERAPVSAGFKRDQWDKGIVLAKNAGAP